MTRRILSRRWLMGAGAGVLLLAAGLGAGPLSAFEEDEGPIPATEPGITVQEVLRVATAEHPDATPLEIELENEGGLVYGVEFSDGFEVELDAETGEILETEQEDAAEGAESEAAAEAVDVPGLSFIEAREIALQAAGDADAEVVGIELENEAGQLAYSVELSNGVEVELDADTGEVLETEQEDETEAEDQA